MLPLANSGKVKSYMGLDINEGMLFHARKKAKAIRESETLSVTATTVAGSLLEGLPFDDGVFDVILLNQVICIGWLQSILADIHLQAIDYNGFLKRLAILAGNINSARSRVHVMVALHLSECIAEI